MDWAAIKSAICEGRKFALVDGGCRFLSDAIMPSGAVVYVYFQSRGDGRISAHDGGAAFDELARTGGVIKSQRGLRSLLKKTEFKLTEDGMIWWDNFPVDQAADAMSFVSDASLRAAHYLLNHAAFDAPVPLDVRVREALKLRFPHGIENRLIDGAHKQHRFDFSVQIGNETVVVQSVTPEPSSFNSAIVKALDAQQANSNVIPLLVYDRYDTWSSDAFGMLELGGKAAAFDRLADVDLLAA